MEYKILSFEEELSRIDEINSLLSAGNVTLEQSIGDIKERPVEQNKNKKSSFNSSRLNHDVLTSSFGNYYYRGNRRRGWQQPSFTIHATADNIPLHPHCSHHTPLSDLR